MSAKSHPSLGVMLKLQYRTGRWGVSRAGKGAMKAEVEQELVGLHYTFLLLASPRVPILWPLMLPTSNHDGKRHNFSFFLRWLYGL
jgi:hypothetical protein